MAAAVVPIVTATESQGAGEQWEWAARADRKRWRAALAAITSAARDPASSGKVCGGSRTLLRYLREYALPDADLVLVVANSAGRLAGFATLVKRGSGWKATRGQQRRGRRWIELDLVCAWDVPGLGTRILHEVEAMTRRLGGDMVELHSVPSAVPFYRARGFVNARPGACTEHPEVTEAAAALTATRFVSDAAAVADPAYRNFLELLIRHGSAASPGCRGTGLRRPQCSFYGYRMNRCLGSQV
jgi:Acetyltransferase (GNAT) domain